MQAYNDTIEREQCLADSITELNRLTDKLSKLNFRHKELINSIISALGHDHKGQKSYEYNQWKIEVKTPCVYSLDKKLYEVEKQRLPKDFNPVKETVAYSVDKRLCDRYIVEAPQEVRDILIKLIDERPGKASVCVKELV